MDADQENRLLDCAVLIATHAINNTIPDGISHQGDYMTLRKGPHVWVFYAVHKWSRQLIATIGEKAFAVAVFEGTHPQTFARAAVQVYIPAKSPPKLLKFYIAERIRHAFVRDRTARMRMDVSQAQRLPALYGGTVNKMGRTQECADALA